MARKKKTSETTQEASTVNTEATETQQVSDSSIAQEAQEESTIPQESEANSTKAQDVQTKKAAKSSKAKGEASSYIVTWKTMAGKTVKGLGGVLMSFDGDGKATVDAVNAKRLLKIKGVEIIEG